MTIEPGVLQEGGLAVHALGDALWIRALAGLPGVHVTRGLGRGQNKTGGRCRGRQRKRDRDRK